MAAPSRRQHIVPQQMIKRFADDKGKLLGLRKPTLSIGTRMRSPREILFRDYYYDDSVKSFDEGVLKPIEQKFARHYAQIADAPWEDRVWPGEVGAAFVDWVAAQFCRTGLLVEMNKVIFAQEGGIVAEAYAKGSRLADNLIRAAQFQQYQDLLSRPLWHWKCCIFPAEDESNLVITDNPVCLALELGQGDRVFLVPLSKKRVLFGGKSEVVDKCGGFSARDVNFCLAAWAEREVYAAERRTLEFVLADLRGEGIIAGPSELLEAARKPLFGLPERSAAHPVAKDVDTGAFWREHASSFGPPIPDDGGVGTTKPIS
jgi:hypothetical protein